MSQPPLDQQDQPVPPAPAPKKKTKKWPLVVAGVVVLIVIAAAVSGGKKETSAAAVTTSSSAHTATTTTRTTTTTTTTTTTPVLPPEEHAGTGDDVVTIARPGPSVVAFECGRCTSNVVVKSNGAESLLVNTIGAYKGKRLIDIRDGSYTTTLTITANSAWKLTVGSVVQLGGLAGSPTDPVSGHGDDVLMFAGGFSKAKITNAGESNFVVQEANLTTSRFNLVVNTIGGYQGTVPLSGPSIVAVTSSGDWTIKPGA